MSKSNKPYNFNAKKSREAIPVGRFSTAQQDDGDSERRQQKAIERILARWDLTISTRYAAIFDKGRSAFHGKHLSVGQLGKFLTKVKCGLIKPDANGQMPVLCFEAVDRLTRLHPLDANELVKAFVDHGIAIVFDEADLWIDAESIADKWEIFQILIAQAYRYSKKLQTRILSSWKARRTSNKPATTLCPHWISWDGKTFILNTKAAVLKEACLLSIAGHGASEIRKRLGITSTNASLTGMFHSIALMGQHQDYSREADGTRKPIGEVRIAYYPALITQKQYYALQSALAERACGKNKGRRGDTCTNLFTNLLINTSDGTELCVKRQSQNRPPVLNSKAKLMKKAKHPNLRYAIVEEALLSLFVRIQKSDLFPALKEENAEDKLVGKMAELDAHLNRYTSLQLENLNHDYSKVINGLEAKRKAVQEALEVERRKNARSANPLSETQEALAYLAGLSGTELLDARVRAKALIRQLVKRVDVSIASPHSAAFVVHLTDGSVLTGDTAKVGQYQVSIRE